MRIDSSGNVGIGTTSPVYKLDVSGTARINSAFAQLTLTDTTGGTTTGGFIRYISNGASGSYTYQINTAAAGDFTTANNVYTISSAGNVGIGTNNPTTKLEVAATNTDGDITALRLYNNRQLSAATKVSLQFYADNDQVLLTAGRDAAGTSGNFNILTRKSGTQTSSLYIDSSGNVGIGTTSPAATLDVNGSIDATSGTIPTLVATTLLTTGTGTAAAPAIVPTGDTNTGVFFPAADTIAFSKGGTESLRINSSSNVSIGTATALSRLHVHGDLTLSNATTAVTASTSTITPPATVAGYLTVSINGTSRKIAYYAT
jgi:hypothetical protein